MLELAFALLLSLIRIIYIFIINLGGDCMNLILLHFKQATWAVGNNTRLPIGGSWQWLLATG